MDLLYQFLQGSTNGTAPDCPPKDHAPLHWDNVGIASLFILVDGAISLWLGLRLEKSLFIAALRCIVQLTIMGYVLEDVFRIRHPALAFLSSSAPMRLSTTRPRGLTMAWYVPIWPHSATFSVSPRVNGRQHDARRCPGLPVRHEPDPVLGTRQVYPEHGHAVGQLYERDGRRDQHSFDAVEDKVEMSLSYGATRWEAGRPIMIEAIRLAMLPTINQMSVIGLIAIPGMMTGQIIGGAPVMDAVKYQQIIMFMISASTGLGVVSSVVVCLLTLIDNKARLRPERIQQGRPHLWHDIKIGLTNLWHGIKKLVRCGFTRKGYWDSSAEDTGEWARLLS
ncbi:hypothetical protein BC938DRAFT_483526 [Jimgerdemannia flammicorona]|uniref:Uncharacterized protein n=1 Tax=Jimgerdemannia flammicorona TaxID=994334 RepID=A0A433QVL6_9FUNG|nr:hypothetical protein BC938DRAFT_483526 [Jimgerdemannia flammicorona]